MILSTHAVIGAAAASVFPEHPVLAFGIAVASHFVFDAIPHWHYPVGSAHRDEHNPMNDDMVMGKQFFADVTKIGFDALLGIGISVAVFCARFHLPLLVVLIGAIGGILPDPLQFVYWKFRHEPLISLQRFHIWIHARTNLDDKLLLGVGSQILLILISIVFVKYVPIL